MLFNRAETSKLTQKELFDALCCWQGLQDPHPKARWAACQAIGQMCTDLGPELQTAKHQLIVPGLMGVMDDFSQPRVQAHAAAAIVNFSENCEQVCPVLMP
jgi:importin-5